MGVNTMPIRLYRPVDEEPFDEMDILDHGKTTQREIRDIYLDQIATRVTAATNIAPVELYFFAKRQTGRRCSCWEVFTAPRMTCRACFGTGLVGGFEKFGFREEVVDVTRAGTVAVNVSPGYDRQTAPTRFSLAKSAVAGYFEATVALAPNLGILDAFQADYSTTPGTLVKLFVRSPSDVAWVELVGEGATALVQARLGETSLRFRAELSRSTPSSPIPEFETLYLRYQTDPHPVINADVERTPTKLTASELGAFLAFEERKTFIDGRLKRVTTEDFFEQLDTKQRWKVIRVDVGRALGHTFEHALNSRIVHDFKESYAVVP
jgi:hypothetical protein